jgi:DNA helicase IV
MKNLLATAALVLGASTAQAEPASCATIGEIAQVIMENRQMGIAMSDMMAIAEGNAFIEGIVLEAYRSPRFSVPANQAESAMDFRTTFELMCYEEEWGQ